MNTQELIQRYRIALKIDEHGQPNGNLVVYRADKAALAAIKAAKPEIVAALLAQREAGLRAEQERQAKIDAIPGLREIEAARTDLVKRCGRPSQAEVRHGRPARKISPRQGIFGCRGFCSIRQRRESCRREKSTGGDHQRRRLRTSHFRHGNGME